MKKLIAFILVIVSVFTYFSFDSNPFSVSAASIKKSGEVSTIKEYGIDVSKHNGEIDWKKVKKSGVDFAIIRAGYSHTVDKKVDITIDKMFNKNYKGAKEAGVKVGIYVYSYATTVQHAREDAEALAEFIKGKTFEYPIYYDMEDKTQLGLTTAVRTQIAYAFVAEMKALGYYAGVYANEDWFKNKLVYEQLLETGAIWFAKWMNNKKADLNYCDYGLWQYTSEGRISGISGNVDLNVSFIDYSFIKKSGLNGFGETYSNMYIYPIFPTEFNGKPVTSDPLVLIGDVMLRENIDYTVTYYNNDRAGVAIAVYNGINDFKGYQGRQMFTIKRKSFSLVDLKKIASREYTGSSIRPDFILTDSGNKLVKNRDYKISYKNNKALGTATVTITGINYIGTKKTTFKITKRKLKNCEISGIKDLEYNGKTRKFSKLKVKINGRTISSSAYSVKYSKNKSVGLASVTISAKSKNLTGSVKKTFKINPKPVKNLKVASFKDTSLNLKWSKVSSCDGYMVYRKNKNGKYEKIATIKDKHKCSFTDKNLEGNSYSYKVRSYKKGKYEYLSKTKSITAKKQTA